MKRNMPIPENDWNSMNVRFDDIEKMIADIKGSAVNSSGFTLSEYEKLNAEQRKTINNQTPGITPSENPSPTPNPTPGSVPTIKEFTVSPQLVKQSPTLPSGYCVLTGITITWDVIDATKITLIRTPEILGLAVNYTLSGATGTKTISISQQTSFILKAENSYGNIVSSEYKVFVQGSDSEIIDPTEPPSPEGIPIPTGLAGSANGLILVWTWTEVSNADKQSYQLYASKTTGFDPDTNPPADLTYRVSFGNHTNTIATGAAETWYAKVRQVAKTGKSGLSSEANATST